MVELIFASQVLLWTVAIVLIVFNILMLRQIGVLFERVAPGGALATNSVLKKGDLVPVTEYPLLEGGTLAIGGEDKNGKDTLVMFIAPNCPVCKTLLPAAISLSRAEASSLFLVFASAGNDLDVHRKFVAAERIGKFNYVISDALGVSFGVAKLPYAVLVSADGAVASFGLVNTREHLESLVEARERDVASIQEYIGKNQSTQPTEDN